MSVKRQLKPNEIYVIQAVLPPLKAEDFVGYRLRLTMQLADDFLPRHFLSVEGVPLGGTAAGQKVLLQGVRLRLAESQRPVCRCKAYSFPHHQGKGRCYYNSVEPFFCGACGKPCDYKSEVNTVSSCCEAELFEDCELTKSYTKEID